jgi:hypothetical protein
MKCPNWKCRRELVWNRTLIDVHGCFICRDMRTYAKVIQNFNHSEIRRLKGPMLTRVKSFLLDNPIEKPHNLKAG